MERECFISKDFCIGVFFFAFSGSIFFVDFFFPFLFFLVCFVYSFIFFFFLKAWFLTS